MKGTKAHYHHQLQHQHSANSTTPSMTNSELYLTQHPSVERIETKDLILNLNVNTINSGAKGSDGGVGAVALVNGDYQSNNLFTDESDYESVAARSAALPTGAAITQSRRLSNENQTVSEGLRQSSRTPTSMSSDLSRSNSRSTLRDDDEDEKAEEAIINDIQDSSASPQNEPSSPPPNQVHQPTAATVTLRQNPANGIRNQNKIQR
jgi:hypothetical protein